MNVPCVDCVYLASLAHWLELYWVWVGSICIPGWGHTGGTPGAEVGALKVIPVHSSMEVMLEECGKLKWAHATGSQVPPCSGCPCSWL